jgi:DNA-binding transcriptional regulator GbsR (MarR family)
VGAGSDPQAASVRLRAAQDQFVLEWGRMSSSWGINRTMAQIHALLLVTGEPHTMEDICGRLHISRGNASMNLRDLMDWNVVRRFRRPGDRKDLYVSDSDAWETVARVARERKRREIDPTRAAILECLQLAPEPESSPAAKVLHDRLHGLLEIFRLVDLVYDQALRTDEAFKESVEMFRRATGNAP